MTGLTATGQQQSYSASAILPYTTPMRNSYGTSTSTTSGTWSIGLSAMGCSNPPDVHVTILSTGAANGGVLLAVPTAISATAASGIVIVNQGAVVGSTPFALDNTARALYYSARCL